MSKKRIALATLSDNDEFLKAAAVRQEMDGLLNRLRSQALCKFCFAPEPGNAETRVQISETWYYRGTHRPLCGFCGKNAEMPATTHELQTATLCSLQRRVHKELAEAVETLSDQKTVPAIRLKELKAALKQLHVGQGRGRGVRSGDKKMSVHVLVGQLWRTISRVQLEPDLNECTELLHTALVLLNGA